MENHDKTVTNVASNMFWAALGSDKVLTNPKKAFDLHSLDQATNFTSDEFISSSPHKDPLEQGFSFPISTFQQPKQSFMPQNTNVENQMFGYLYNDFFASQYGDGSTSHGIGNTFVNKYWQNPKAYKGIFDWNV